VVYATIELAGRTGGIWRSENAGASWTKMSDYTSGGTGPHYYQELYVDPHRFDVLYHANVRLGRTEDGGKTWENVESRNKHVDNHAVAFHPTDPDFLVVGCDGGIYRSWDYAATYEYCANLPLTQFYKLDVDYDEPFYHVVGGTQDNNTQWGPTRTRTNIGIRNADWRITIGGDGHDNAIDPTDPNVIYSEAQQGYLRRFDRLTGESVDIRPRPEAGEEELRYNWDAPLLISPHLHTRLYFGSKKLHRSDDRGDSWATISPDLSRDIDRFTLPHMGRVWSIDAMWDLFAMSQYGNITSISESPIQEGLIYIGTDDGLIQVTENGGETWRKIDGIPGLPEMAFVNDVKADLHDVDTVYAVFDDHKRGDFAPYVMRSRNRGRTWESIVSDLPERHVAWRIIQDHVNEDLLFLGTEFGVFWSPDAGGQWMKLAGAPNIPFRDLEIQRRENDLVGATFGRGFYVLDDYTPLRDISADMLDDEFRMFDTRPALLYIEDRVLGGPKGSQGDAYYAADNPAYGAWFTYYLKESAKTRKQMREARERDVKKEGGDNVYPGWDALKAEEREEDPVLTFTVTDMDGDVVRRITGPTGAGLHRIAWDLRYADPTGRGGTGPLVVPGAYRVTASQMVDDQRVDLDGAVTFEVKSIGESALPKQDRAATLAFQMETGELQKQVVGTTRRVSEMLEQLAEIKSVVRESRELDPQLHADARTIELQLLDIQDRLTGDSTRTRRSQMAPLSISQRVGGAFSATLRQTHGPTETNRRQFEIGREQFAGVRGLLRDIEGGAFADLAARLDAAGAAWTPGRTLPATSR
ncbi:MAG: glycosyl hydrolase, partial [Phycisphaerales bacterium]